MRKVVATGKTIDDAIQNALYRLHATVDQVGVRVLKQPSRGLFGFIGSRDAEVEVELLDPKQPESVNHHEDLITASVNIAEAATLAATSESEQSSNLIDEATIDLKNAVEEAYQFLNQIVKAMNLKNVKIELFQKEDRIEFQMFGADIGVLIGKHGHTLDSLQYLVNLVANKHSDKYLRIVLDAEGYRLRRREALEKLADRLAERAIRQRNEVVLEPMSAAERKIIHSRLQDRKDVKTQSRGEEPFRKIVIIPHS